MPGHVPGVCNHPLSCTQQSPVDGRDAPGQDHRFRLRKCAVHASAARDRGRAKLPPVSRNHLFFSVLNALRFSLRRNDSAA